MFQLGLGPMGNNDGCPGFWLQEPQLCRLTSILWKFSHALLQPTAYSDTSRVFFPGRWYIFTIYCIILNYILILYYVILYYILYKCMSINMYMYTSWFLSHIVLHICRWYILIHCPSTLMSQGTDLRRPAPGARWPHPMNWWLYPIAGPELEDLLKQT